ncbi:helix-turn-helix domain-containing protein [Spirosoma panaciterrae]|uniref:helix-turn-helix domain-containing protein n=1 Tax=Spirosoma panaciterrae TaxID=496058 RepID=UPI00036A18CF|nr:helix-turn-helix domain-containing protein [Spirosoma panaciterrae]
MTIDFEKLQSQVSETHRLVQTLLDRLNQPITSSIPTDELLTVGQAAELLNVTNATIYGYIFERKIPFCKPSGGGRIYFIKSELVAWIKQGRQSTAQELDEESRIQVAVRLDRRKQSKQRLGGRKAQ